MKHHLDKFAYDRAEFTDDVVDTLMSLLNKPNNPSMFLYIQTVMVPTVLYWIVISLAELSGGEARYYLANGGKRNAEKAVMNLEAKSCKYC